MVVKEYDSPCGHLYLAAAHSKICLASWNGVSDSYGFLKNMENTSDHYADWVIIEKALDQLKEYFDGGRMNFDIPFNLYGTDFQIKVWERLMEIPYGYTVSYLQLAENLGNPKAVRAVAHACGANPISIIVPCHRVISSSGQLTGYAGGIEAKRYLLALEASRSDQTSLFNEEISISI